MADLVPAVFFLGFWFVQQAFYGVASLNTPTNIGMEGGGIALHIGRTLADLSLARSSVRF